jgi:double-GTPase-like protein
MPDQSIVISGLQGSGKTTFLAALWHLMTSHDAGTKLRFGSLRDGDATHLNAIAARWRDTKSQIHTELGGGEFVSMNLLDPSGTPLRLTFPDLSGEEFREMWEIRECDPALKEVLASGDGMLFFINADRVQLPLMTVEIAAQAEGLGIELPTDQRVEWNPRLAPTQVQIVDLLQLFCTSPIELGPRRIGVVLSLWDKVEAEGLPPEAFLAEKFPLVDQYLRAGADAWTWKVFGVSAQGGDYESENQRLTPAQVAKINQLKALDEPSLRIRVVSENSVTNDLTEPIEWLRS